MKPRLLLSVALLAGCSRIVYVVDAHGTPLEGAEVYALSPSFRSGPNVTDGEGHTALPRVGLPGNIQDAMWVEVTKPGFKSAHVNVPDEWPLQVILLREGEDVRK